MNIYRVPFDFQHEEKIFGGYLSLRQMLYMILGVSSSGIFFVPLIPVVIKTIIFLLILVMFILFAFFKIGEIYVDKHFINIIKYIVRKKIYLSER